MIHDATALEVAHDVVPGEGHRVLVLGGGVVLGQGVRQEALGCGVNVAPFVHDCQDNNCNLKRNGRY